MAIEKTQAGSVNYQVVDGRLPKQTNEIALDTLAKTRYDYKMGDKITLNDAAIKEKGLTQTHFTVVGFINSPEYIDNTSRGNHNGRVWNVKLFWRGFGKSL